MLPLEFYLRLCDYTNDVDVVIKLSMVNKCLYYLLKYMRLKKYRSNIGERDDFYILGYLEYIKNEPGYKGYIPKNLYLVNDSIWNYLITNCKFTKYSFTKNDIIYFCEYNKLDRLKFAYNLGVIGCDNILGLDGNSGIFEGINKAIKKNHKDMVKWMFNTLGLRPVHYISYMLEHSSLDIIRWIYNKYNIKFHSPSWIMDHIICQYERLDILEWLHKHKLGVFTNHHMRHAIKFKRVKIYQWLFMKNIEWRWNYVAALSWAVKYENMDDIRWFYERKCRICYRSIYNNVKDIKLVAWFNKIKDIKLIDK